jgi:hypothetical protein
MARALPFDTAPVPAFHEIGTAESGKLKFRQLRAVSIAERTAVREANGSDALFVAMGELADKIHQEAKALQDEAGDRQTSPYATICSESRAKAYDCLQLAIAALDAGGLPRGSGPEVELALRHTESVRQLQQQKAQNSEALVIRQATVMIRSRLQGTADWTDDDTRALDSEALILDIALFYQQEQAGMDSVAGLQEQRKQLQELEEALGKLLPAPGSPPPTPTGESSTGDAALPTQAAPSLSESGLATSQSPTSSTRQRRRPRPN